MRGWYAGNTPNKDTKEFTVTFIRHTPKHNTVFPATNLLPVFERLIELLKTEDCVGIELFIKHKDTIITGFQITPNMHETIPHEFSISYDSSGVEFMHKFRLKWIRPTVNTIMIDLIRKAFKSNMIIFIMHVIPAPRWNECMFVRDEEVNPHAGENVLHIG